MRHKNGLEERIKGFYKTIKSRIIVAVVVQRIRCGSMFTFDYAAYLFLASFIALLGLLMDSSVVIVASMLVSPVMGPILAIIFGCIVADTNLRNKGIKNAFISILVCTTYVSTMTDSNLMIIDYWWDRYFTKKEFTYQV